MNNGKRFEEAMQSRRVDRCEFDDESLWKYRRQRKIRNRIAHASRKLNRQRGRR